MQSPGGFAAARGIARSSRQFLMLRRIALTSGSPRPTLAPRLETDSRGWMENERLMEARSLALMRLPLERWRCARSEARITARDFSLKICKRSCGIILALTPCLLRELCRE